MISVLQSAIAGNVLIEMERYLQCIIYAFKKMELAFSTQLRNLKIILKREKI